MNDESKRLTRDDLLAGLDTENRRMVAVHLQIYGNAYVQQTADGKHCLPFEKWTADMVVAA